MKSAQKMKEFLNAFPNFHFTIQCMPESMDRDENTYVLAIRHNNEKFGVKVKVTGPGLFEHFEENVECLIESAMAVLEHS